MVGISATTVTRAVDCEQPPKEGQIYKVLLQVDGGLGLI